MARLLVSAGSWHVVAESALSSGVKELRDLINDARRRLNHHGQQTVLFIDEVHGFSKFSRTRCSGRRRRLVLLVQPPRRTRRSLGGVALLSRLLVLHL